MYIHVWIYVLLLRMMQCSNSARLKMSPKAYERNMLSVSMYEYTYVWVHVCVHLIRATPIEGHPLQRGGGRPDNQKGVDQQAVVQVDEQTHRHRRILIHRWVCACIHKCKAHAWHTYILWYPYLWYRWLAAEKRRPWSVSTSSEFLGSCSAIRRTRKKPPTKNRSLSICMYVQ